MCSITFRLGKFNVIDRATFGAPILIMTSQFGQITSATDPRILQLSLTENDAACTGPEGRPGEHPRERF
jgi:hypothetical protein